MSARTAALVVALAALVAGRSALAQPAPSAAPPEPRPLAMRDLAPTRSLGVLANGALVLGLDEPVIALGIAIDADIALGEHVKLFAAFPIVAMRGFGRALVGAGNLEAGALVMSGGERLRIGAGAAAGLGATPDGFVGELQRFDPVPYDRARPVLRGFLAGRADRPGEAFVQLAAEVARGETWTLPGARVAGGWLAGELWLLGELQLARLVTGAEDEDDDDTIAALELGVRGRFTGHVRESWCGRATFAYTDGLVSMGLGVEIRTW